AEPQRRPQRLTKAGERRCQLRRVEQPKQAAETVVARNAVRQIDDLAEHCRIRLAKIGNIDGALRSAQARRQRDEQHRAHKMPRIDIARIADFLKNRDDRFHPRLSPKMRASSESIFPSAATQLYSSAIPLPLAGRVGAGGAARSAPTRMKLSRR